MRWALEDDMELKNIKKSTQIRDDLTHTLNFQAFMTTQMEEIDLALEVLNIHEPDLLDSIVTSYITQIQSHTPKNITFPKLPTDYFMKDDWKHLKYYLDIIAPLQSMLVSEMRLSDEKLTQISRSIESADPTAIESISLELQYASFIRICYYHLYHLFFAVESVISREKAHELAQKFGEFVFSRPNPNRKKASTLEEFRDYIDGVCTKTHNYVSGFTDLGQYIFKVTRCLYGEALCNVDDPDLMYYLICYGDYFSAEHSNDQFVLTRESTILQHAPICDFCYHDRRKNMEIEHPDPSFWKE